MEASAALTRTTTVPVAMTTAAAIPTTTTTTNDQRARPAGPRPAGGTTERTLTPRRRTRVLPPTIITITITITIISRTPTAAATVGPECRLGTDPDRSPAGRWNAPARGEHSPGVPRRPGASESRPRACGGRRAGKSWTGMAAAGAGSPATDRRPTSARRGPDRRGPTSGTTTSRVEGERTTSSDNHGNRETGSNRSDMGWQRCYYQRSVLLIV
mmetsp:Transcript_28653/g.67308  ORF Transcript_28653/g.67308 Transcript_28653/m.67308 type:complete len:214 (+) Transcript_28653:1200-1841(+)